MAGPDGNHECPAGCVDRTSHARRSGIRVAFYGRSARDDGAHLAIQRQLAVVVAALPADAVIVAFFADVGAWNGLHASTRGCGGWARRGRVVDGGLIELLHRTRRPNPGFEVMACSDVERVSRRLADRFRLEQHFVANSIALVIADGPMPINLSAAPDSGATIAASGWPISRLASWQV